MSNNNKPNNQSNNQELPSPLSSTGSGRFRPFLSATRRTINFLNPFRSRRMKRRKISQNAATNITPASPSFPPETPNPPKQVLSNYKLGKVIGEGAYGEVFKAVDIRTKKSVAIKVIELSMLRKYRKEDSVKNEIEAMRRLEVGEDPESDFFVGLLEVQRGDDKLYLVMDLVEGKSLQETLRAKGVLKEKEARKYLKQLIVGVKFMHGRGVLHRDIKPSNLFYSKKGVLKIMDMGESDILEKNENGKFFGEIKNDFKGTPSFVSPEIMSESGPICGFKADMWAIGVTLYYLIVGKIPFKGQNIFQIYNKIEEGSFEIPSNLSNEVKDLLIHLLDSDSTKRFGTDEVLSHPWIKGSTLLKESKRSKKE